MTSIGKSVKTTPTKNNSEPIQIILTSSFDVDLKNKLMQLVPSAKQAVIENAGHVSNLENPGDFNKKLASFIDEIREKVKKRPGSDLYKTKSY